MQKIHRLPFRQGGTTTTVRVNKTVFCLFVVFVNAAAVAKMLFTHLYVVCFGDISFCWSGS